MLVSILGVPIRLNCRMADGEYVAYSPDWPVDEVTEAHPIAAMRRLAAAIEVDMSHTLFARRRELLQACASL